MILWLGRNAHVIVVIIIARPHRMHEVQKCGLFATDVAWVCLCVCLLDTTVSPTKRLNRSRCSVGYGLGLAQETIC